MAGWMPHSLRALLGRSLDDVDATALNKLIGLAETESLEFKAELGKTNDSGRRELAADVTQFANTSGGLLIFGIAEEDGVADHIAPLDLENRPEPDLWIDQVLAAKAAPSLLVYHRIVDVDGGKVLLVSVPPSISQPHAVLLDNGLRYVIRSGKHKRSLSEHEVAQRYRERILELTDRVDRSERAIEELRMASPPLSRFEDDLRWLWLLVSAVPDIAGLSEGRSRTDDREQGLLGKLFGFPGYQRSSRLRLKPKYRGWKLGGERGYPSTTFGTLEADGSAALGLALQVSASMAEDRFPRSDSALVGGEVVHVRTDHLVADLINASRALTDHALSCGAAGSLTFTAQLVAAGDEVSFLAVGLNSHFGSRFELLHGSEPSSNPSGTIQRSISLDDDCLTVGASIEAARLLADDLLAHFAEESNPHFVADGSLNVNSFGDDFDRRAITQWIEAG